jgi:hypothetical protein
MQELQAFPPQMPVKVFTESVGGDSAEGFYEFELNELDATEADTVRLCGGSVVIKGL